MDVEQRTFTVTHSLMDAKYYVTLESGRSFVLNSDPDWYTASYDALEEAALMDDYLINIEPIT
tara:strand:- start:1073 stop:1261 length:189 start_codon:yes stop_codon:yes gene_type:complete